MIYGGTAYGSVELGGSGFQLLLSVVAVDQLSLIDALVQHLRFHVGLQDQLVQVDSLSLGYGSLIADQLGMADSVVSNEFFYLVIQDQLGILDGCIVLIPPHSLGGPVKFFKLMVGRRVMSKTLVMYQDNTQTIKLFGLHDGDSGAFWTTAVLEATLVDQNGAPVTGCIDVGLIYQPASTGNYFGTVQQDFKPDIGDGYVLIVDGDQGAVHLHLEIPTEVRARKS